MRGLALSLAKVAGDIRLLASGPLCGLAELRLPELQPGSSIMPGKVNPVMVEAVLQVVARVAGNDTTVAFGSASGMLQLNTSLPVIADALHESVGLLAAVIALFDRRCVRGIEVDAARCAAYASRSPALVTGLVSTIGYERAARAVHDALASDRALRDVLVEQGLTADTLDRALDAVRLARGGVPEAGTPGAPA